MVALKTLNEALMMGHVPPHHHAVRIQPLPLNPDVAPSNTLPPASTHRPPPAGKAPGPLDVAAHPKPTLPPPDVAAETTADVAPEDNDDAPLLIPALPRNHVALHCLARVPPRHQHALLAVSPTWHEAFLSGQVYALRRALRVQEPWIYLVFCPKRTQSFLHSGASGDISSVHVARAATSTLPRTSGSPPTSAPASCWLEAYDPGTNTWHHLGPIPGLPDPDCTLKGFGFVALHDKLYIVGGRLSATVYSSPPRLDDDVSGVIATEMDLAVRKEVLMYNCTTRRWSQCASMSTPRVNFAFSVCDGRIYVAGGRSQLGQEKGVSSAEVYVPEEDTWHPLPNMSTGRYKCVGVTCEDLIHIVGGFAGPPDDSEMIHPFSIDRSCVDVFQPSTRRWEVLKGMWQLDVPPNQIVSVKGRLYSSGDELNKWKGRIEVYDTELNMWKIVDASWLPMTHPEEARDSTAVERCYLTMAPIGHLLYFLGGYRLLQDHTSTSLHTIYVFDTTAQDAASQWQMVEPIQDIHKDLCSHCCVVTL